MAERHAILDLQAATPSMLPGAVINAALDLRLDAGEFALIECRSAEWAAHFADVCCGLHPLQRGVARFLGRDWARIGDTEANALRGRIGRVFHGIPWVGFLDMETNILLSQRYHTRRGLAELRAMALELSHEFGLPGLPVGAPTELPPVDLARAACVRAFLGEPLLVILEHPLPPGNIDLPEMLINAVSHARNRGAAVLWLTPDDAVWRDRSVPVTQRLRLSEGGLAQPRHFS